MQSDQLLLTTDGRKGHGYSSQLFANSHNDNSTQILLTTYKTFPVNPITIVFSTSIPGSWSGMTIKVMFYATYTLCKCKLFMRIQLDKFAVHAFYSGSENYGVRNHGSVPSQPRWCPTRRTYV